MKKILLVLAAGISLGGVARQADANIIYSDFGPGNTFGATGREVEGTSEFGGGNNPAYTFTPTASGTVSQIDLALVVSSGSVVASLWTAATGCGTGAFSGSCGGLVPTTELGSWTAPSPSLDISTISGITGVSLTAGTKYYLQLSAGSPTTVAEWFDNSVGASGTLYQCGGSNSTFTLCLGYATIGTATIGAFDILSASSSVPEPASLALFSMAVVGLGLIRHRYGHHSGIGETRA
jgi:hypothetical protein